MRIMIYSSGGNNGGSIVDSSISVLHSEDLRDPNSSFVTGSIARTAPSSCETQGSASTNGMRSIRSGHGFGLANDTPEQSGTTGTGGQDASGT